MTGNWLEVKEIKVPYRTSYGGMSKAYVTADSPHVGIDKYTGDDIVLVWHEDEREWRLAE